MLGFAFRAITSVAAVLYTTISIHACSVQPQTAAAPALDIPLPELTHDAVNILNSRANISQSLQQAAERFTSTHKNTRINVQTVANENDYRIALRAKLVAGEAVELFHTFGYNDTLGLQAYLEDLSAMPWGASAMQGTLDSVTIDGKLYGIPYSVEGMGLIANRSIFEAVNISLGDIYSFEDLADACKQLQEQIDSGDLSELFPQLEAVTEFAAQDKAFLSEQVLNIALQFPSPTQAAQSLTPELTDSAAMEEFIKLMARYSSHRTDWTGLVNVAQNEQVENGLASGRVALIMQNADIYERVYAINPELKSKLMLLPVFLDGYETGCVYTGVPAYWSINQKATDGAKTAAKDFLTWLYQSGEGAAVVAEQFVAVSAYRDTAADTKISLHNQLLAYMRQGMTLPQAYRECPEGWSTNVFATGVQQYFTDKQLTWDDVAKACQEKWMEERNVL